ncbi:hypothetical protein GQ54DRAFT_303713 [Martensiomyces pterosporus]|nr:hypothetical protein GQ54DRAFT_303713 [Martensiomyces pterosporus]
MRSAAAEVHVTNAPFTNRSSTNNRSSATTTTTETTATTSSSSSSSSSSNSNSNSENQRSRENKCCSSSRGLHKRRDGMSGRGSIENDSASSSFSAPSLLPSKATTEISPASASSALSQIHHQLHSRHIRADTAADLAFPDLGTPSIPLLLPHHQIPKEEPATGRLEGNHPEIVAAASAAPTGTTRAEGRAMDEDYEMEEAEVRRCRNDAGASSDASPSVAQQNVAEQGIGRGGRVAGHGSSFAVRESLLIPPPPHGQVDTSSGRSPAAAYPLTSSTSPPRQYHRPSQLLLPLQQPSYNFHTPGAVQSRLSRSPLADTPDTPSNIATPTESPSGGHRGSLGRASAAQDTFVVASLSSSPPSTSPSHLHLHSHSYSHSHSHSSAPASSSTPATLADTSVPTTVSPLPPRPSLTAPTTATISASQQTSADIHTASVVTAASMAPAYTATETDPGALMDVEQKANIDAAAGGPSSPRISSADITEHTLPSHPAQDTQGAAQPPQSRTPSTQEMPLPQPYHRPPQQGEDADSNTDTLRTILERVMHIERHCESLVQIQTQQTQQIGSLEATVRKYADLRQQVLRSPLAAPASAIATPMDVSPTIPGAEQQQGHSPSHSRFQSLQPQLQPQQQQAAASSSASSSKFPGAASSTGTPTAVGGGIGIPAHETSALAQYPKPAASAIETLPGALPGDQHRRQQLPPQPQSQQQLRHAHQPQSLHRTQSDVVYQERDTEEQYATYRHHQYGGHPQPQQQQQQPASSGGYALPPSSSLYQQQQRQPHSQQGTGYSSRTSPVLLPTTGPSPYSGVASALAPTAPSSSAHSPSLTATGGPIRTQRYSGVTISPVSYRVHESGRLRRGSIHHTQQQQQQQQHAARSWSPQHPPYPTQGNRPASPQSPRGDEQREVRLRPPYLISQQLLKSQPPSSHHSHVQQPQKQQAAGGRYSPQPQHQSMPSAFGYTAAGSATGSSSGMSQQYSVRSVQVPPAIMALPGTSRAKRARVSDTPEGSFHGGSSGDVGYPQASPSYPQHPQQPQQRHLHPHSMLPPIQTSAAMGGGRGSAEPLSVRVGAGAGAGMGSIQLLHPDRVAPIPVSKLKGKAKAGQAGESEGAGAGRSAMAEQAQQYARTSGQQRPASGEAVARGNPDAQPTHSWLATQRQYKIALLHLLTLESFYPSDIAMLNMFRAQGDFTNEQIEANSAALLSWARSWLRYNRNAVLRSTLENKAKATLPQLAEALQHDLHATTDFTTPANIRRCALLRLIYFQWQSVNKLGTKSQSLYRDYETRLREIEALPTIEEQEADWALILKEEQARRLALIRESRGSGSSVVSLVDPRPPHSASSSSSAVPPGGPSARASVKAETPGVQRISRTRRQSLDWPEYAAAQSPPPPPPPQQTGPPTYSTQLSTSQLQQQYSGMAVSPPQQQQQQQHQQHQQQQQHQQHQSHYQGSGGRPAEPPFTAGRSDPLDTGSSHQHHYQRYQQQQQQQQQQHAYQRQYHHSHTQSAFSEPQLHRSYQAPDAASEIEGSGAGGGGRPSMSKDDDSEMSVNLSPEPQ